MTCWAAAGDMSKTTSTKAMNRRLEGSLAGSRARDYPFKDKMKTAYDVAEIIELGQADQIVLGMKFVDRYG